MPKTLLKPRWTTWEEQCIRHAFEKKVQLKIIAAAMGRTLNSVRKKLTRLGLPMKLIRSDYQIKDEFPAELLTMRKTLKKFAPLEFSQKGQLALRKRHWVKAQPLLAEKVEKGECIHCISQDGASFSFEFPLHYVLSEDPVRTEKRQEKSLSNLFCIPLSYMEEWAASEGFQPVPKNLRSHGFSYWKQGEYFSKAQLLIYVNRIRLEKKLHPLAYHEEG